MNKRIDWVDVYKGLGIILIVVGHTWSPYAKYIYLFHVPAFFFISGFTTNFRKYNFSEFLTKRLKGLILPYFIVNLLFILLHIFIKATSLSLTFYRPEIIKNFGIYGAINSLLSITNTEEIGGATWFLVVLFEAQIFAFVIHTLASKYKFKNIVILALSFVSLLIAYFLKNNHFYLSYLLDLAFIAVFFVLLGYLFKETLGDKFIKYSIYSMPIAIISIYYFANYNFVPIDFPSRSFGNIFLVILTSLSGINILSALSVFISKLSDLKKIFIYIGQSSLWILCLHFLGFKIFYILLYNFYIVPYTQLQQLIPPPNNTYWYLVAIAGLFFSLFIKLCFDKRSFFIKLINKKINDSITILSVLIISTFMNFWILNINNFFYADDFGHFLAVNHKSISSFFYILPKAMYNDRPIGSLFIKFLFNFFQFNNVAHHSVLLIIHLINTFLAYIFVSKLLKYFKVNLSFVPFLASLLFTAWPKSNMAIQWDSAIFDILICFFVLLFLNICLILIKKKNVYLALSTTLLYIFMLRTKESSLLVALIPILIYTLGNGKHDLWSMFIKGKKIVLILSLNITLMFFYFFYLLYLAKQSNFMSFNITSPYFSVFNPLIIVRNIFRYLYLYFDFFSSSQTFTTLTRKSLLITFSFVSLIIYLLLRKRTRKITLFLIMSLILSLLPVLPLLNMQHKLYLYVPSVFLSIMVALIIDELNISTNLNLPSIIIGLSIIFLAYINFFNPSTNLERRWWLSIGKENRTALSYIQKNRIPKELNSVEIVNLPNQTNIFNFGPGDSLRLVNNKNLHVEIKSSNKNLIQTRQSGVMILDYSKIISK